MFFLCSFVNSRILNGHIFLLYAFVALFALPVLLLKTLSYNRIFSFLFREAFKMTSRPLKRSGRPSKRKCRKRGLSISSLIFRLVVLFSIVYTVYQFVPSHESKSNLLSKYYRINVFPHFVLNSYCLVSYSILICPVTFYLWISIAKLETCLQV